MRIARLLLIIFMALLAGSAEEQVNVGPITLGIDLSSFGNANIIDGNNMSQAIVTDNDGYWFEEHRAFIDGEGKTLRLVFRKFANDVYPNNYLALYDLGEMDLSHYENTTHIIEMKDIISRSGNPTGMLTYSFPYPETYNSHIFLSDWLSDREELIIAAHGLTCEEWNATVNSIYINGFKDNQSLLNIDMHCG